MSERSVTLTVNGRTVAATVEARTLLIEFLRDSLRLTGAHVGCDSVQCGACVVHLDGQSVKSCNVLVAQADGRSVTTIEGLAGDDLHPEERFKYGQPDLHTRMKTGYPRLVVEIMTLRKPVVAMVAGYAIGGGHVSRVLK